MVARLAKELNIEEARPPLPHDTLVAARAHPIDADPPRANLPHRPSALYGAALWRLGILCARVLPAPIARAQAVAVVRIYAALCKRRRAVVVQNLLPALDGDRDRAEEKASLLFRQFAHKLVDLWRFEAGLDVTNRFGALTGWEHFLAARQTGRGILLVTPHLGNWEFGAPLLAQHGFGLHVITLVEPGHGLTELRQAARARAGIDTVVIGRDPFAFVEIIRRLEAGATVALLLDRPPKTSAVTVELFGRPFAASIAAAELARATGCELVPVYLVANGGGYGAHILPSVGYDRAALRARGNRQQLTQRLMTALEPAIRQHAEQWYHFVPVWNDDAARQET